MNATDITRFDQDQLSLQPFAHRLEKFLFVERQFVQGGLVVSIGAPFGAGKTTFLRMWHSDLIERRKADATLAQPIILNAWESDFCGDPLLAIVTGLIKALEAGKGEPKKDSGRLREAAKEVAWFATGLANSAVAQWTGIDAAAAGEFAKQKSEGSKPARPDILRLYEDRVDALNKLRSALEKQFGDGKGGALIMVDELDRCRPDYAISYLETIKHVFNVPGLVFVLAVDYHRLSAAAKAVFGDLNFDEYYRKFVHRTATMPKPDEKGLTNLARIYTASFLEVDSIRVSLLKIERHTVENIVELVAGFQLTPRQIQEAFRIIGHTLASDQERRGRLLWCIGAGVMLLAILRVGDRPNYDSLRNASLSHFDFGQLLIARLGKQKSPWWFSVYITGVGSNRLGAETDIEALYRKLGFLASDAKFDRRNDLGQFSQGWGHGMGGRITEIFTKIEEVASY